MVFAPKHIVPYASGNGDNTIVEPEARHRRQYHGNHHAEIIDPGVLLDRGNDAERDPQHDRDHHGPNG